MKKKNWLYWGVLWMALILNNTRDFKDGNIGVILTTLVLYTIIALRVYSFMKSKEYKNGGED